VASIPLGYQQITSLSSATALTIPAGAQYALITCEVANVRWRDDGSAPTASVGMILATGSTLVYEVGNLALIQFIQVSSGAILNVSYYRN
jgi:hypothetical protein